MLFTTKGSTGLPVKSFGSRMYFTSTGSPARRETLAALRRSTSYTPLPTVPKPRIAILAILSFPRFLFCYRLYPQRTPTTMRWRESFSVSSSGDICMVSVRMVTATSAAPFSGVD